MKINNYFTPSIKVIRIEAENPCLVGSKDKFGRGGEPGPDVDEDDLGEDY